VTLLTLMLTEQTNMVIGAGMQDHDFKDLMTGVCAPVIVVTTADDDGPHGATVGSFAALSLQPPLVTGGLDRRSALLARILSSGRFAVNVLASSDDELALLFATRGEGPADRCRRPRFEQGRYRPSPKSTFSLFTRREKRNDT